MSQLWRIRCKDSLREVGSADADLSSWAFDHFVVAFGGVSFSERQERGLMSRCFFGRSQDIRQTADFELDPHTSVRWRVLPPL